MKRYLTIILAILTVISAFGKDDEVIMTKQITSSQRDLIPDKTDELKLQNYEFIPEGNFQILWEFIQTACKDEFEYRCLKLNVREINGQLTFSLFGYDPMKETKDIRDSMAGVIKNGYYCIIVDKTLARDFLKKGKGKTKFIREFELVEEPRINDETHIEGTIINSVMNIDKYVIDGENKLAQPEEAESAPLDYQESNQQKQQINTSL